MFRGTSRRYMNIIFGSRERCGRSVSCFFRLFCELSGAQRGVSRDRACSYIVPLSPLFSALPPPLRVCLWKVIFMVLNIPIGAFCICILFFSYGGMDYCVNFIIFVYISL